MTQDRYAHKALVKVMTEFFCDKLEDEGVIHSALRGLIALSKLPTFANDEVIQVVNKFSLLSAFRESY